MKSSTLCHSIAFTALPIQAAAIWVLIFSSEPRALHLSQTISGQDGLTRARVMLHHPEVNFWQFDPQ